MDFALVEGIAYKPLHHCTSVLTLNFPSHHTNTHMAAKNSEPSDTPKYLQKVELTQENKDLIANLPSDTFWRPITIHQYDGFWHTTKQLQGILNSQKHFNAHDSDILLVTLPKSGTTWLKALTYAMINRMIHYPNPNLDKNQSYPHPLVTANPHDLVPFLEINIYIHENIPDLRSFPSPRLFASHMSYISLPESVKLSKCKIVYLCRNPKDMFTSMWHFIRKLVPQAQEPTNWSVEESFERFCEGRNPSGPFWDHILGYYKQSLERPYKVMFLTYEELKSEPTRVLKDLAEFMGHGFTKEEESGNVINDILKLCSFENLSNLEVNKTGKLLTGEENNIYFRRGDVGEGENFLTSDMIEKLNVITQEKLGKHGLNFQIHKS
ncbi:cytosolic sulfotransferase 12-like [Prosopis cineraria]|uniref:cytosolic sulfotransferase 12-like n=1 Tax=Prosopis cineraria TaxID=364024 RepID=UPI00240F6914|nr:cytosolic sulfotransferase 12-like [Prosopis cineraria]XP_054795758.1 cytosolic sulfotransferase 12-like [Prosopis cineraria]